MQPSPPPQFAHFPAAPVTAPRRRLSAGLLLGMHAALWSVALLVLLVPYHALDNWVVDGWLAQQGQPYFRTALADWAHFTLPFLVGGAVALAFLRPRLGRILAGLGCALATVLVEWGILPLVAKAGTGGVKLL